MISRFREDLINRLVEEVLTWREVSLRELGHDRFARRLFREYFIGIFSNVFADM